MSRLLEIIKKNNDLVIYLSIVLVLFIAMFVLFLNRGTYSVDEDVDDLSIECSSEVTKGGIIDCSIVLNSVTMSAQGISAKYSVPEGVEFVSFTSDTWEVNTSDLDGFVLLNLDGVSGNVIVGNVKFTVPITAQSNEVYRIELLDVTIGNGSDGKVSFENIYDEVRVISDINTLDNINLSIGSLDEIFDKDNKEYNASVDSDKVTISVEATDKEHSTLSGDIGELSLHYGTNSFSIIVTSESGIENTYIVNIFRVYNLVTDDFVYSEENNYIYTGVDVDNETILSKINIAPNLDKKIENGKLIISYNEEILLEIDILNVEFSDYSVVDEVVNVADGLTISEFSNKILLSDGLSYKIYSGSDEIFSGDLSNEMIIKIYYKDVEIDQYNINVIEYKLSFDSSLDIDEENKYIKYLDLGITVSQLISKMDIVGKNVEIVVYTSSSDEIIKTDSASLATGDVVVIYLNGVKKDEYTLSVLGDSNGDGMINSVDLVQIRLHIVGWINPNTLEVFEKTGVYYYGIDMNKDGIINSIDLVKIRKKLVGIE